MRDFALSAEQLSLRDTVRQFMARECPPERVQELDQAHTFPMDTWRKLGAQGWLGLAIPEQYGGAGASLTDIVVVSEALAYGMCGLSSAFQRSACYGGMAISAVGTEEQKREILPRLASGEAMVAIALSEPEAGSDAAALRTRAVRHGDGFRLSGQKIYTSGALEADWIIVVARTDPDAVPRDGLTAFLVPRAAAGMELRPMAKLGNWTVSACEVFLDDVDVPSAGVLGELNGAWRGALAHGLDAERLVVGSHCTGGAQRTFDVTLAHAQARQQFGRPIGSFQMIKQKLVDMATRIESARLLTQRAAWLGDQGLPCRKEGSMAKLAASETWNHVASEAMQILGGMGYMMESEVQRHYRDARLFTIGAGTSEIQRLIIARELGL